MKTTGAAPNALIEIRRDSEIYAIDGGWFQARWHFSFDQYFDPQNMGIGTLRVFNHDTLVPGAVWPMHPHRDIEGITYVVAGTFEHADSAGNGGVLPPGAVQRVTLGSGMMHSERNHSKTEPMQFIQMWIIPEQRGLPPSIEQRTSRSLSRRTHRSGKCPVPLVTTFCRRSQHPATRADNPNGSCHRMARGVTGPSNGAEPEGGGSCRFQKTLAFN